MAKGMFLSMSVRGFSSSDCLRNLALLCFVLLAMVVSDTVYSANRLVGGADAESEEAYPWMVSLRSSATGEHVCGGTLVHRRWVMSASNCFYGEPAEAISVYVGDYDLARIEDTEQRMSVVNRVESGRDLMLLELAESVDTDVYPVLRMANAEVQENVSEGDLLTVVGWGDISSDEAILSDEEELSTKLGELQLPVYAQFQCYDRHGGGDLEKAYDDEYLPILGEAIDEKHICAGHTVVPEEGPEGVCNGDNGGPLLLMLNNEWYQVGVTSLPKAECGGIEAPDLFTRVSEFKAWIDSVIYPVNLVSDTAAFPEDITMSLLKEGENPVCSSDGEFSLDYDLKDVRVFPVSLINQSTNSVQIENVSLLVEEIETDICDQYITKYTPTEFSISREEGVANCDGIELASGERCDVPVRINFLSPGLKSTTMEVTLNDGETVQTIDLNLNVLGESNFSRSFGSNVFFFMQKNNEWRHEGDIVAELVSDFQLYESAMLIAKVEGSGEFSFDWKVESLGSSDFSVWVNGEKLTAYQASNAYKRETIVLPEEQVNTVVWKLAKGELWSKDSLTDSVYLKSVNFLSYSAEVDDDTEESEGSKSSGGASSLLSSLMLLILLLVRRGASSSIALVRTCLAFAVVAFLMVGSVQAEDRIIGGNDAEERAYPWMVSIQNKYTGEHICGGTLVDEFLVLTAAHCYRNEPLNSYVAVVGAYDLNVSSAYDFSDVSGAEAVSITGVQVDELGDFLLFKLSKSVSGSVIRLATEADMRKIGEGETLRVIGWGDTDPSDENAAYPDLLQEVDLNYANQEWCADRYAEIGEQVTEDMICAGLAEGGADSCQGDSGGPLLWLNEVRDWVQIGVTSFGEGCGNADYPGVYTRVASYLDLVEDAQEWSNISLDRASLGEVQESGVLYSSVELSSNLAEPFEITWVRFESDDILGFQVIGDQCSNEILYLDDSCELDFKVTFEDEGLKNVLMTAFFEDGSIYEFDLTAAVYPDSSLLSEIDNLNLVAEPGGAWQSSGDELRVDLSDKLIDANESDANDDVSRIGASFYQAGVLSFNWQLLNSDEMNLDVYVDGARQTVVTIDGVEQDLSPSDSSSAVYLELPEEGAYVEWVLAKKRQAGLGSYSGVDAIVQGLTFTALSEPEEDESEETSGNKKSSSGGTGSFYLLGLTLLMLLYRARKTL